MSTPELREFDERIHAQTRRFLLEVLKVFAVFGGIVLFGWGMASQQAFVFKVRDNLLAEGAWPLLDVRALESFPSDLKLVQVERTPNSAHDGAWASKWEASSGSWIKIWALDSFGLNEARSEISGRDPLERSFELFDSLAHFVRSGESAVEQIGKFRDFVAVRIRGPDAMTNFVMRSGRFVLQMRHTDSIGYQDALEFAYQRGLIERPVFPEIGWNRVRLNLDYWAAVFAVLAACLWMWQITTAGTRAARFEVAATTSPETVVASGLRTLASLHPAIELTEGIDGRWTICYQRTLEGRHLQRTETATIRHEFRIRMHQNKAIVVESVRSKTRASEANILSMGWERSRILPMIEIPGGTIPIKPTLDGFVFQCEPMEPASLRYALVVFFLLHGWGWEPRLF